MFSQTGPAAPRRGRRAPALVGVVSLLILVGCRGCREADQPAPHGDLGELSGCEDAWLYLDQDGDGYGDPAATVRSCAPPPNAVTNAEDCDDADPAVSPAAEPLCADGLDNDCDGQPDCASLVRVLHPADASAVMIDQFESGAGYGLEIADLTGDGVVDILIGAPSAEEGDYRGRTYLVAGPARGTIDLTSPDVPDISSDALNQDGTYLCTGDLDGDGYDDLEIGVVTGEREENGVFIVPGPLDPHQDYALDSDGATYLYLPFTETSTYGRAFVHTADLIGEDGQLDLMLNSGRVNGDAGSVFFVPGPIRADDAILDVATTALYGTWEGAVDEIGTIDLAGDLNGDGVTDLVAMDGELMYLVFELPEGTFDLADVAGLLIYSEIGVYGRRYLSPGDVDGDGLDDLLETESNAYNIYWDSANTVFLFSGSALNGSGGETLDHDSAYSALVQGIGYSQNGMGLAAPGDVNEDGYADLFIGDPEAGGGADYADPGRACIWYGPIEGTYATDESDSRVLGDTVGSRLGWRLAARPRDEMNNAILLVGAWPLNGNSTLYQFTPDGF